MPQNYFTNPQAQALQGPYAPQQQEILRRQKMAQLLQQQAMQPIEAPQGGMFTAPISPLQVAGKLMQGYWGGQKEKQADTQQKQLAEQMQAERQQALAKALQASQAQPAQPMQMDAADNMQTPAAPAMPADPARGLAALGQSKDPTMLAQYAPIFNMQAKQQEADEARKFRATESAEARASREGIATESRESREAMAREAREQRMHELKMRLADQRLAAADRAALQRELALLRTGVTATAQKELIETEEQIQGGQAALSLFQQAKALNDKAMGFTGAGAVASAGSLLPEFMRPETVDATQNLDNMLQSAALPQLKAIFGGMPTEGERKILLDVQGSSSKPPKVRAEIFNRAEEAIKRRMEFNAEKAKRLRAGSYFSGGGLPSLQSQSGAAAPQTAPSGNQGWSIRPLP